MKSYQKYLLQIILKVNVACFEKDVLESFTFLKKERRKISFQDKFDEK